MLLRREQPSTKMSRVSVFCLIPHPVRTTGEDHDLRKMDQVRRMVETNPALKKQLDDVVESKVKQSETLQALQDRMKQAELSLEQSLTALATVDSQIQLIDAEDIQSGRSIRLREDIQEQVLRLDDLVSSINQVYDYHSREY